MMPAVLFFKDREICMYQMICKLPLTAICLQMGCQLFCSRPIRKLCLRRQPDVKLKERAAVS